MTVCRLDPGSLLEGLRDVIPELVPEIVIRVGFLGLCLGFCGRGRCGGGVDAAAALGLAELAVDVAAVLVGAVLVAPVPGELPAPAVPVPLVLVVVPVPLVAAGVIAVDVGPLVEGTAADAAVLCPGVEVDVDDGLALLVEVVPFNRLSRLSMAVACAGGACDEVVAAGTVGTAVDTLLAAVTDTYGVVEVPVLDALGVAAWPVVVDEFVTGAALSQLTVIGTPLMFAVLESVTTCWPDDDDVLEPVLVGVNSV